MVIGVFSHVTFKPMPVALSSPESDVYRGGRLQKPSPTLSYNTANEVIHTIRTVLGRLCLEVKLV